MAINQSLKLKKQKNTKKKNVKKIQITENIFDTDLTVYVGYGWGLMLHDIKKNYCKELFETISKVPESKGRHGCMMISLDFSNAFLWMDNFEPRSGYMGTLVHEMSYYVFHNLNIKEIKHETQSENEVYSYYLQMLITTFLDKFFE